MNLAAEGTPIRHEALLPAPSSPAPSTSAPVPSRGRSPTSSSSHG